MSMREFAEKELKRLERSCTDSEGLEMQQLITSNALQIIDVFCDQHHSGFSANYLINILNKLLKYQPLSYLTGEDDEWIDVGIQNGKTLYQNNRYSAVFKEGKDGVAYDINGKVYSDDLGRTWYTSKDSSVNITFPYEVPASPEYVIIDNKAERSNILDRINNNIFKNKYLATEDDELSKFINYSDIESFKLALSDEFKIKEWSNSFYDDDKMWHVITNIMHSDKEE